MFPGLGGLNPKKMQGLMKQMGISQSEIDASKVIIEKADGGKLIIENPSVTKMNVQGNEMLQVSGEIKKENEAPTISEDDVKQVVEKTGATEEQAKKVLESVNGDLAEAILELSA
ncbi:nascent polypeptide-associated complex protein [archaeon]|jgi:nascent polypeptide-associated complex subunit alpha|nr:nascent polypeptide-associated complex protein [archaeon]MBT4373627.1 nascent polypeptide-associated complex protein [archaeon]MBT4531681.1 nascent polypeptide-associated complex protein [archaeon]MBT7001793.1 nascent polypeptide-associated complex protein [archaeon]MBT7281778.1 nascent polypeptide-associated complex protein [archaeon]